MNVGVKCCLETCGKWMHTCEVTCRVRLFETLWTEACQASLSVGSPGKNTGVSCHSLLQRIFPTWGSNTCLCTDKQILYHWATKDALWFFHGLCQMPHWKGNSCKASGSLKLWISLPGSIHFFSLLFPFCLFLSFSFFSDSRHQMTGVFFPNFSKFIFIYLVAPGFNCNTQNL